MIAVEGLFKYELVLLPCRLDEDLYRKSSLVKTMKYVVASLCTSIKLFYTEVLQYLRIIGHLYIIELDLLLQRLHLSSQGESFLLVPFKFHRFAC